MLQPLQLKEVFDHYPNEIAELRDFLTKADHPPLSTADTLSGIAARLREDRAYRRDLTSHIWVVMHQSGQHVSYSDLLGMLAIAAAGPRFAAAADENDAHQLLRFLMEARHSFGATSEPRKVSPIPLPSAPAVSRPVAPIQYTEDIDEEVTEDRRPVLWMGVAACLLVALLAGIWWHYQSLANQAASAALATRSAAAPVAPTMSASNEAPLTPRPGPAAVTPRPTVRRDLPSKPSPSIAPIVRSSPAPRPFVPAPSRPAPSAVAAAPSSKHLATPPAPTAPSNTEDATAEEEPPPFQLLRRQPAAPSSNSNLAANTQPANPSSVNSSNRVVGIPNASRGGIVRSTSLGSMASNVMYSPVPIYPTAASSAHVQGEVKLEAEVDQDGNVTSARVISGPPLLREAATDALEHWRYRPYLYAGKPISMNALVVMDFKLP